MSFLKQLKDELKEAIEAIAVDNFSIYKKEIVEDADLFLKSESAEIESLLKYLKEGKLTQKQFLFLLKEMKETMKLYYLKKAGAPYLKIEAVRAKILNIVARGALNLLEK